MTKKTSSIKGWKIPLYKVYHDSEDLKMVSNVIKRGTDWAIGPEIEQIEKKLSNYLGVKYCLVLNSGTSALHASLLSLGIKNGHEVIVPSFSFIATANSVLMTKANPRFVDIDDNTYGLNPIEISKNISKKTKAIIPVHYAGLPCKIKEIISVASDKKIPVIEDAAESLGAMWKNKKVGSFGDLAIFSFAGNKVITTGEGGAIVTNSKKIYDKIKLIRSHGRDLTQNYFSTNLKSDYITLGYNWRMSSITAALAISQLEKIDKLINLRRKHAHRISQKLRKIKSIVTPNESKDSKHVYQLYSILLPNSNIRNNLMEFLTKKKIMSKVFFYPIHSTTYYSKIGFNSLQNLPMTNLISKQILTLPMYPSLTKEELDYIVESVQEFCEIKNLN